MILVTGAGGGVGRHLLQALSARSIATRAWIHREENKEEVLAAGATEIYIGDLTVPEDAAEAMEGIDTIYYICNAANPLEDEIGKRLIKLAKEIGGITFIYHSVMHALLTDMPHHAKKLRVEKALVDSGMPYVIIQPTVFMQMLTPAIQSVKNGGPFIQKFYTSVHTRMSYIDLNGYAEEAAEVITSGSYQYGTYEFCGDGACSLADMETIFSDLTGRKVTAAFISDKDFLEAAQLAPDSYAAKTLLTMFRHYNENSFCGNDFTLRQILGRPPVTVRAYLEKALKGV